MKKYKLIIFDMDGTILDTLEDLKNGLNYALSLMGFPERTLSEVRAFVGNGIRKLMERAVPSGTDEEMINETQKLFTGYYKEHCYDNTKPYGGIVSLIRKLKENGFLTAVVSNKDDYAVKILCDKFFCGLFDFSAGVKDGVRKKPSPDMVNSALEVLKTDREDAVYIGDSEVDAETAKNSRLECIAVLWGFRDREILEKSGVTHFARSAKQLEEMLNI